MSPILKSIKSLANSKIIKLIILSLLLALGISILFVSIIAYLATSLLAFDDFWLQGIITGAVTVLGGVGGWFMFPILVMLLGAIFMESVIKAIEPIEYLDSIGEGSKHFWSDLLHDIKFCGQAVLLNLIILPFYLIGIGVIIAFALNAYLLAREFFEGVAGHHGIKVKAREIISQNKFIVYSSGVVIAVISLVPVLNFISPILATIIMVHVYHHIRLNKN